MLSKENDKWLDDYYFCYAKDSTAIDTPVVKAKLLELEAEITQLRQNNNSIRKELTRKDRTITRMGHELGDARKSTKDTEAKISRVSRDAMALRTAVDSLTAERSKHLRKIKRLENRTP